VEQTRGNRGVLEVIVEESLLSLTPRRGVSAE
jgi:hypothetical protein